MPKQVANLTIQDDNLSELSNYVPSVVKRSYDALNTQQQQQHKPVAQYADPRGFTNRNQQQPVAVNSVHPQPQFQEKQKPDKSYSQTFYTAQGPVREGIPTPPRTDRPPQQQNTKFQQNAPKPVITRQESYDSKQRRQPLSYASDENWRVLTPVDQNVNNQQHVNNSNVAKPVVNFNPNVASKPYEDDDDSSEIDVDAPTPPLTQNQKPFFRNSQNNMSKNIYEQNRPRQIGVNYVIALDNEVPKGYQQPNSKITSVKPHLVSLCKNLQTSESLSL